MLGNRKPRSRFSREDTGKIDPNQGPPLVPPGPGEKNDTPPGTGSPRGPTPNWTPPADPANFSWSGNNYAGQGLTGNPGQYGNNFIGMQGYLAANTSPGLNNDTYNTYAGGANADYTKNMNSLDSSLYNYYGVTKPPGQTPPLPVQPGTTGNINVDNMPDTGTSSWGFNFADLKKKFGSKK